MGKPRGRYAQSRKFKGQALATARQLFGVKHGKFETKEQRADIAAILRLSDNERMRVLSTQCMNWLYRGTSVAMLAEKLGLNYHDLSKEIRAIKTSEGYMRAAQHLPDIMEQTAIDALGGDEACKACEGSGEVVDKGAPPPAEGAAPTMKKCPKCNGDGSVYVKGDMDSKKLMFETFQLTGGGRAPIVNLDLRRVQGGEELGDLAASVSPILEGKTVPPEGGATSS